MSEMFSCTSLTGLSQAQLRTQKLVPSILVRRLQVRTLPHVKQVGSRTMKAHTRSEVCSPNAPLRTPCGKQDALAVPRVDCIAGCLSTK